MARCPGFGVGFPYKPQQRVISEQVFTVQGSQMGLRVGKANVKIQTFLDRFETCLDEPGRMGFSARPFMILSLGEGSRLL